MKACEGLLINSVAYLETGKSPVWIAGGSAYTSTDLSGSLEAQNTCLNEFVATLEFNIHDMPPACMVFVEGNSREIFPQDSLYGTFRDRIIMTEFSEQIPHPFPYIYNMTGYNRTRHRIDGYCGLRKPTKTHAHVESEEDKTKFLTYIPVFDHYQQLRALQNGIQIAKAWNMMLLLPRFYDFSKGQFDMGLATSSPSVKYSDIYDIKHLKKYHHLIGEVDDYSGVGLDYIFNVSLKSSGPYILSPLEFYADVGLLIPRTRLLQMDKLIQLSDIKNSLSKNELRAIGLSQAHELHGGEYFGLTKYLRAEGAKKVPVIRHKFSRDLMRNVNEVMKAKSISDYGCVHLVLGNFEDYCRLERKRFRNYTNKPRNVFDDDDCFNADTMVQRAVSSFSSKIESILFVSNDIDLARSLIKKAIDRTGSSALLLHPQDVLETKEDPFGAFDRVICSDAKEALLYENSAFSLDIQDRLQEESSFMYIGNWGEWQKPN
jgi:hypothetical protein